MSVLARLSLAVMLALVPEGAWAHAILGVTGFPGGLLHPLLAEAHFLSIAALALLIGQQQWPHRVQIAYAAALVAGLGAIAMAYVPDFAEDGVLVFGGVAGLLVALARPLPWALGVLLAAALAAVQALDSPPEAITLAEANLTLLGTAISAVTVLVVLARIASLPHQAWQKIAVRILGSWIAACAILVLALKFLR
jgi:urease accessory protein